MNNDLISKCSAIAAAIASLPCVSDEDAVAIGKAIDAIPAVDAVEVVHGEWKYLGYVDGVHPKDVYACSNCGKQEAVVSGKYLAEFEHCRKCGAKMDGERKCADAV